MTMALPDIFADPVSVTFRLQGMQRAFLSPFGGSEQVLDMLQDRWVCSVQLPPAYPEDAAALEAWINGMRGMTQVVNLYHLARPTPRGTMRGAPTVISGAFQAASFTLQTAAGATLRAGDMLGTGGLLLQVGQDCAANGSGVLVVPLVNRLRKALVGGAAVAWSRPSAPFRLVSPIGIQFVPGYAEGASLDFAEAVDL